MKITEPTEIPPPCYGNPAPFDAVTDRKDGPAHDAAVRTCRDICAECPIPWKTRCLQVFIDHPSVIAGLTLEERDKLVAQASGGRARAPRRCEVEGCYGKHLARGFCSTHYHQERRSVVA